jgi:hypothetical protein
MLDPAIRNNVLKTYGKAPYSNGCFGDSGGPLFVAKNGQTYIAGVGYWTGLYCEDYGLYTRIDPFLPFLDAAYKKGGQEVLKPTFNCIAPAANGAYTAYFGYDNKNGVSVSVPLGNKNQLALDTKSRRTTLFAPGVHPFEFGVKFNANQTVSYTLSPENSPTTTLSVNKNSTQCSAAVAEQVACASACEAQLSSGCPTTQTFADCMLGCIAVADAFEDYFPGCGDELTTFNQCVGNTPPGADNWICDEYSIGYSTLCVSQEQALGMCITG